MLLTGKNLSQKVYIFSSISDKQLTNAIPISLKGLLSIHGLCYVLHGILLALHVVLIPLLIYHPEHHVTMSSDSSWVTTTLAVSLQAFYVVSFLLYPSYSRY